MCVSRFEQGLFCFKKTPSSKYKYNYTCTQDKEIFVVFWVFFQKIELGI